MCTHEDRAQRYRAKAQECLLLSELAASAETRDEYRHLAECYGTLALAEERLAQDHAGLHVA